ncbi:hypothetical protein J6590_064505 [Homalodisca vitripennis]|nr:hypothetical protein J6590_064505 [Homalodisca vitripennis]
MQATRVGFTLQIKPSLYPLPATLGRLFRANSCPPSPPPGGKGVCLPAAYPNNITTVTIYNSCLPVEGLRVQLDAANTLFGRELQLIVDELPFAILVKEGESNI